MRTTTSVRPKTESSKSRGRKTSSSSKTRASAGAARIQAARDRIKKGKKSTPETRARTQGGLKAKSSRIKPNGLKPKAGKSGKPGSFTRRTKGSGLKTQGKVRPGTKSSEKKRRKTARKDYVDSIRTGPIPGGGLISRGGRPNTDVGNSRARNGLTPGTGRGGAITGGSGHGRNLWSHNNRGYRHNPYSNYYWNWNVWGSGYGWLWCPTQWATTSWWDSYWYNGGYWNYGYRPSFYYGGPFTAPQYTVVAQVNQAPIEVIEEQPAPVVKIAEDVAPAPRMAPAINRAAEYYLTLGDRAFRSGRYTDAVHHYGKAVEYSPGEGILYLILSDALFATADYHYGAFALRKALDLDPGLVDLTVDKRSFYDRPSDLDAQMTRARTYILQNPNDNDVRLMLIANEVFIENPEAALALIGQPESKATAETNAGMLLQERARIDLARKQQNQSQDDAVFEVVPLDQD